MLQDEGLRRRPIRPVLSSNSMRSNPSDTDAEPIYDPALSGTTSDDGTGAASVASFSPELRSNEGCERSPPPIPNQSNLRKMRKRLVFGTSLLAGLCCFISSGHLATLMLVLIIQVLMFRELVNVRYSNRAHASTPLYRTTQWGLFFTCMLYTYGNAFRDERMYSLVHSRAVRLVLTYVEFTCLALYSLMLIAFVLTLQKGYYKYQMGQLTWTIATIVITVVQVNSFTQNIFNGLFWFLYPVSLVICNDSMAYFCGVAFGRKLIKRPFLGISPNKTWEGFIGGEEAAGSWRE